jgi:FtsP/CotA-like multicopper oxidase with cupredoxin domain
MSKKPTFRQKPTALAAGIVTTLLAGVSSVHAGIGFVDSQDANGVPIRVQTYFQHSPRGPHDTVPVEAGPTYNNVIGSGKAIRKFVDPLPMVGVPQTLSDGTTSKYIPVAVPEKWVNPAGVVSLTDDYFEIACVEYTEKFHSDIKKPSTLRGYVQLSTVKTPGKLLNLYYPNSSGQVAFLAGATVPADARPIMIQATDANNKLLFNALGKPVMKQAQAVDYPHYLGPAIVATQNVPTRLKFYNLLPVGRAQLQLNAAGQPVLDAQGHVTVTNRNGDLMIPVDPSLTGAGFGPDGVTKYTQNRIAIHLHGGDTPWVSDGTALTWFTPAGEADPTIPGSLATQLTDPVMLQSFLHGSSYQNVPDMNDPGAGAQTFYYPNGQSARLLWYHDHAAGLTRLNAYVGMAAPYVLTDAAEADLVTRGVIPADTVYLVVQEKGFVPDDVSLQDARWNTTAWGAPGDLSFSHVYETVQDPKQLNAWNPVGRWHYGPWFWPVFPSLYPLPTGGYGDETTTPENWLDTPVINGVAYPVLNVDPKAYRFRILNGSNDRGFTFNLFKADTTKPSPFDATNFGEVPMVPAQAPTNPCAPGVKRSEIIDPLTGLVTGYCTPDTWAFDGRNGGVPDPAAQGPTIYQFGNEAGLIANVAVHEPAPTVPLYDVSRVTVLNVNTTGLWLGNAERADAVIDFTNYANTTLIAYNDMYAATPAGDPRNDYFTGIGDQSQQGGAEDTKLGYGPNIRTLMQIRVAPTLTNAPAIPFDPAVLAAEIPAAYGKTQPPPIVAQSVYNAAFGTSWNDNQAYASIYTGSLKQPTFVFTPGDGAAFNGISITSGGSGYTTTPTIAITGGGATKDATATSTLKISAITVKAAGAGYLAAPAVKITTQNGYTGAGAQANATLGVATVTLVSAGTGYTTAPAVTFSKPQSATGVTATGTATVVAGKVTAITITNPGKGYTIAPLVTIAPPTAGTRATATTTGGVAEVILTSPDPANPLAVGGAGYTDLTKGIVITFSTPSGAGAVAPTAAATGTVMDVTMSSPGAGYTSLPSIAFIGGGGSGATATSLQQGSILVKNKAIQELFDPTYGRLNATLGIETPFTSALTQTTIPLNFIDPPTEFLSEGETQIWKITHNGVDTHPVHFHLMNVQLVNRVGWDGFISPPAPNEVGWKETIKMNPLEDIIVAVRAKKPLTPGWGLPESIRPLDETQPLGSPFGFTQIDVNTGLPTTVVNVIQNFGWEYTWHCHILGHEENDFMRPMVFKANEAAPTAPTGLTAVVPAFTAGTVYPGITLTWTDTSNTEYKFDVQRAIGTGPFVSIGSAPANMGTFTDTDLNTTTTYNYQVVAVGAGGTGTSNIASATTPVLPPKAPAAVTVIQGTGTNLTVSWTDMSVNETSFIVQQSLDGGVTWTAAAPAAAATVTRTGTATTGTGTAVTVTATGVSDTTVMFRVAAASASGQSVWVSSNAVTVVGPPTAPTGLTGVATSRTTVALSWVDASKVETAFVVQRATVSAAGVVSRYAAITGGTITSTTTATTGTTITFTDTTAVNGTTYRYQVSAQNALGSSTWTASANVPVMFAAAPPTSVTATAVGQAVTVSWVDGSTDETSFVVTGSVNGGAPIAIGTVAVRAGTAAVLGTGTTIKLPTAYTAAGGTWVFSVAAVGPGGTSVATASAPLVVVGPPPVPATLTAAATSATQVALSWVDTGTNETSFTVQRATVAANGTVGAFAAITGSPLASTTTAATGGTVTFTDSTAVNGTTYQYRVAATNATGSSAWLTSASVPVMFAPTAPSAVTAVVTGTSVAISWTDNSANETSFVVTGSLNGGAAVAIGTVARTGTAGSTTGAVSLPTAYTAAAGSWTFSVAAVGAGGTSAVATSAAVVVTAPPAPAAPTAVSVTAARAGGTDTATVRWTDSSTNETSFVIERVTGTATAASVWATAGTVTSATSATTGTALSFANTGLARRTAYSFRVVPMNGTTRGTPSAVVTVTTP